MGFFSAITDKLENRQLPPKENLQESGTATGEPPETLRNNQNLLGANDNLVSNIFGFGQNMINAYNEGEKIYASIPFTGDAKNMLARDMEATKATMANPLTTEKQLNAGVKKSLNVAPSFSPKKFYDTNKTAVHIGLGVVALITLVYVVKK